jgi:hypothetical protein
MKTLRDYITLVEGLLNAPKYYINARGEDSTVVNLERGVIEYAGTVAECRAWIKQRDPNGHYTFEEDVTYQPSTKPELTPQERQARLDAINKERARNGDQQRDQQAWSQQQDKYKDMYAKTPTSTPKDTR